MSTPSTLTIATRESPLALWQAKFIQAELCRIYPDIDVNILGMTTRGDQILNAPLAKVGGKGLFVKELETALLDGRADIAVHSAKDMPMDLPKGLALQIVGLRETPYDALVLGANNEQSAPALEKLPAGAVVGTSSLRRKCQAMRVRPDLVYKDLRGNVNTRLAKLDAGEYTAIILAAAGLKRLGLNERVSALLPGEQLLPAVAQGALAIEFRENDNAVAKTLQPLIDTSTLLCVTAERAMNKVLDGGCQVPIAGFATLNENSLTMQGRVGSFDGKQLLIARGNSDITSQSSLEEKLLTSQQLGETIAHSLLNQGAAELLAQVEK